MHVESKRPREPLRPGWLQSSLILFVLAAHAAYFASGVYWPNPKVIPLALIEAELLPEGDSLEAGELAPEGDSLRGSARRENDTNVDAADVSEDAPPVEKAPEASEPVASEADDVTPLATTSPAPVVEKPKKLEKKRAEPRVAPPRGGDPALRYGLPGGKGKGAGTSRVGGRFGVPGGRGQGAAAMEAACLAAVALSIRRHTPAHTSLGPGTVNVVFYVNPGGGISGVSTAGGSAAHAALARRIVASSRGPASCGPAYASQSITFQ